MEKGEIMNERKEYLKNQKASGYKVGDEVRVMTVPESYQDGWAFTTYSGMKIGQVGSITMINRHGIRVRIPELDTYDNACYFPYWALALESQVRIEDKPAQVKMLSTLQDKWIRSALTFKELSIIADFMGKTPIYTYFNNGSTLYRIRSGE